MTETNTARLGLLNWGSSTDGPSRTEFNGNFDQIELLAAIDKQGTLALRPAAGVRGTYYYATDNGILYRDSGSAWSVIGARSVDEIVSSSGIGTVPMTLNGQAGQTADIFKAQVNGVDMARIDKDGDVFGNSFSGKYMSLLGTDTAQVVTTIKGAAGQTADLLRVRNNADADMLKVTAAGLITSPYFATNANTSVVGTATPTTPTGMSLYTTNPVFEVYSNRNAGGSYNDYMYVHHQAADATAVTRRLGLLFQIGDASGDATKSGGIGIESSAASAANPDLIMYRGDVIFARFKSDGTSTLDTKPTVNGTVTINPGSTPSVIMGNTRIGYQGSSNDMYLRAAGTGSLWFFSGGGHSDTSGDAGGGQVMGSFAMNGGLGQLSAPKGVFSSFLQSGASGGNNTQISTNNVQAYNNGVATGLNVNTAGGNVVIGSAGANVSIPGTFNLGGKRVTIASASPSLPAVGDIWVQLP